MLMDDDCFLPGFNRQISDITLRAKLNISDREREILFNGKERPRDDEDVNYITLPLGKELTFNFDTDTKIDTLRIKTDQDFDRDRVSKFRVTKRYAQKIHQGLDFEPVNMSPTIVKSIDIYADDQKYEIRDNYHSLIKLPINKTVRSIKVIFNETYGDDFVKLYSCDFI